MLEEHTFIDTTESAIPITETVLPFTLAGFHCAWFLTLPVNIYFSWFTLLIA